MNQAELKTERVKDSNNSETECKSKIKPGIFLQYANNNRRFGKTQWGFPTGILPVDVTAMLCYEAGNSDPSPILDRWGKIQADLDFYNEMKHISKNLHLTKFKKSDC